MSVLSRGARALQLLPRLALSATTSAAAQEVGLVVLTYVKMVGICIQFVLSLSLSLSLSLAFLACCSHVAMGMQAYGDGGAILPTTSEPHKILLAPPPNSCV